MFLDLPAKSIGHIGGGKMDRTGCVDVAVIQSLYRKDEVKDFVAEYGQVIVDECHHISAFTFEQVMRQVKAKYVVGLTATPTRKDGHHPIIYMQCGPVRFSMSAKTMTETTPFEHKVTPRHTEFRMAPELTEVTIQDIYAALVNDVPRNEMIANDIVRAIESGRCPLLLTGRTEHLQYFAAKLAGVAKHVFVLKGGMGKKQRREIAAALAAVPENESRVILATGSYIGEGFDDARLDTLFLAMPISWKGTLQQYVGRLHRLHDNKRFVQVYDYVDGYVLMLARMYERRLKGYAAIGYVIEPETIPPYTPAAAHPAGLHRRTDSSPPRRLRNGFRSRPHCQGCVTPEGLFPLLLGGRLLRASSDASGRVSDKNRLGKGASQVGCSTRKMQPARSRSNQNTNNPKRRCVHPAPLCSTTSPSLPGPGVGCALAKPSLLKTVVNCRKLLKFVETCRKLSNIVINCSDGIVPPPLRRLAREKMIPVAGVQNSPEWSRLARLRKAHENPGWRWEVQRRGTGSLEQCGVEDNVE